MRIELNKEAMVAIIMVCASVVICLAIYLEWR